MSAGGERMEILNSVVRLTDDLLNASSAHDWEKATAAEAERRDLLERFFAEPVAEADKPAVRAVLERLQTIERELLATVEKERDEVAEKLQGVSAGIKAQAAYQRNVR